MHTQQDPSSLPFIRTGSCRLGSGGRAAFLAGLLAGCGTTPESVLPVASVAPALPDRVEPEPAATVEREGLPLWWPLVESCGAIPPFPVLPPPRPPTPQELEREVRLAADVERDLVRVSSAGSNAEYAPDTDRRGRFLVYASGRNGRNFDLYRRDLAGGTPVPLTSELGDELMPATSPDGRWVAYAGNRDGHWNLFVVPLEGRGLDGPPIRLTSFPGDEVQPTWSPDGRHLAFARRERRGGPWEVWLLPLAPDARPAGDAEFLVEGFLPRFAPTPERSEGGGDGRTRLLVQRTGEGPGGAALWGLWTVELDGTRPIGLREVASARNAAAIQGAWSPDGRRIAFVAVPVPNDPQALPERSDLWIVAADGTDRRRLTSGSARNMQPTWVPGAGDRPDRIVFVSDRGGRDALWSLRPPESPGGSRLARSAPSR